MSELLSLLFTVAALSLTVGAYLAALALQRRLGTPVANPVLVAAGGFIVVLVVTGIPYETYAKATEGISFLLGPATVALAVPLCRQFERLKQNWPAILAGVLAGTVVGIGSVLLFSLLFDLPKEIALSMVPKSVTTPIAMDVSRVIGGIPSLTAALVIPTGILGAIIGPEMLSLMRIKHESARGLALGAGAHGVGTSRAIQESEQQGAMAGLAIALVGFTTAVLAPILI